MIEYNIILYQITVYLVPRFYLMHKIRFFFVFSFGSLLVFVLVSDRSDRLVRLVARSRVFFFFAVSRPPEPIDFIDLLR